MARFVMDLEKSILNDFEKIYANTEKIFGQMTKAGAKVVMANVRADLPEKRRI